MVISLLNAQKGRHTRQIFAQVPEKKNQSFTTSDSRLETTAACEKSRK